jgi:xanthine dehydrogenase molybdopterin-binding subunit B
MHPVTHCERTAHELKIPPEELRRRNFYETSRKDHFQRTHYGQALKYCNLEEVWDALIEKAEFHKRTEAVREFNGKNRWRERGIAAIPLKFGMGFHPNTRVLWADVELYLPRLS